MNAQLNAVTESKSQESNAMDAKLNLPTILQAVGETLRQNGVSADANAEFSHDNYQLLKQHRVFSAMVPSELGGGGCSYSEMCDFLADMAGYHPSTALSLSMHQHIIAANRYNYLNGRPGKPLLEKVANNELVLISTGAGDWLASNGELTKVDGGYRYTATKHFCSGSPAGDVLVTSGAYNDQEHGWQVFHFGLPIRSEGVSVQDNWDPMGMRGTGSNSVTIDNAFIAEETVAVRRARGDFHAVWCVVLPVALPIIMSVYLGIAREAAARARKRCTDSIDPVTPYLLGEMENALTVAEMAVADMVKIVDNFQFTNDVATVNEIVKRKTIAANACKETAMKAMEVCGGPGFLCFAGIESLMRDSFASHFHPLQEKRQHLFTGSLAQGKEPPKQAF